MNNLTQDHLQTQQILSQDLSHLDTMMGQLNDYLRSHVVSWPSITADGPKMTLGGCLMRLHRLAKLEQQLTPNEREQLHHLDQQLKDTLDGQVVAFEAQVQSELHARIGDWIAFLRHPHQDQYARKVDIRLVMEMLITIAAYPPLREMPRLKDEIRVVDQRLRSRWIGGAFVWPAVWQTVYPAAEFWWLYGLPKE